jgi:anti-sigma factor RsiW
MFIKSLKRLREWLPWYVNGTLGPAERRAVDEWLAGDPDAQAELAAWQRVRAQAVAQPQAALPAAVRARLMARVRSQTALPQARPAWRPSWVWGLGAALIVVLLLWITVKPGIAVQWSVAQGQAGTFRVYRADAGSTEFVLVGQLAAQPGVRAYTFEDAWLAPWQSYVYRVQAVGQAGAVSSGPAVAGRGLDAFPYQIAILLTGLAAGYVVMAFMSQWQAYGPRGAASRQTA